MITKINSLIRAGLMGCAVMAITVACTDTWTDHYDQVDVEAMNEGSLWQAIKGNTELSNFASVIEATGYDRSLGSSQVFTVFAPTNDHFTKAQADDLIRQYQAEKATVNDDDNTVVKEFVRNHIALYNHSVSPMSNDSIVLMNGKYAQLTGSRIDESLFKTSNQLYENGVLYTVDRVVDYSANIFEQLRKDADLDSLQAFLYSPLYYKKVFSARNSVEGGIDDLGRTVYLDSVFYQTDELFDYIGSLGSEDSTYWMLAPTNAVWDRLVQEYTPYFNYSDSTELTVGDLDSLAYTMPRLAILEGTVFSQTFNKELLTRSKTQTTQSDSASSTSARLTADSRRRAWNSLFTYYQYSDPLGTVLNEPDSTTCSNGQLLKVSDWKIDKQQTFHRWIVMEAEGSRTLREIGKTANSSGEMVDLARKANKDVLNPKYQGCVWGDTYTEFTPTSTNAANITFNITGVLSNIGYDIYLVTTPALANDSNATPQQLLPTILQCILNYRKPGGGIENQTLLQSVSTSGTDIDYILLAEDFKFPFATWGIDEGDKPSVSLRINNRVTNRQVTNGTHTKTMSFDCVLVVPHGSLRLTDDLAAEGFHSYDAKGTDQLAGRKGVVMYPFGPDSEKRYYKLR